MEHELVRLLALKLKHFRSKLASGVENNFRSLFQSLGALGKVCGLKVGKLFIAAGQRIVNKVEDGTRCSTVVS